MWPCAIGVEPHRVCLLCRRCARGRRCRLKCRRDRMMPWRQLAVALPHCPGAARAIRTPAVRIPLTPETWHSSLVTGERTGTQLDAGLYEALLTEQIRRALPATSDLYRLESV